jgi:hypothetical protein
MIFRRTRERGRPTSGNGASSFHLWWIDAPAAPSVSVTLTVEWEPPVDRLCFWALQASFSDGSKRTGGAHLGLQWNPKFPGFRAVNWGGYAAGGGILPGSESPLPSTPDDRNTRDFSWQPGVGYRLRIEPAEPGWWAGIVEEPDGAAVEVRRLRCDGDRLEAPVVWSEIFTRCEEGPVSVRWSDPLATGDGGGTTPNRYLVSYQDVARGGCTNTSVIPNDGFVVQRTATYRGVAQGSTIPTG